MPDESGGSTLMGHSDCKCHELYLRGCPGCHIASEGDSGRWVVGRSTSGTHRWLSDEDYPSDPKAHAAIDVELCMIRGGDAAVLRVVNQSSSTRAAYVSLTAEDQTDLGMLDRDGSRLEIGTATIPAIEATDDSDDETIMQDVACLTFVVTLSPGASVDLATAAQLESWTAGRVSLSKISFPLLRHPDADASVSGAQQPAIVIGFPLGGPREAGPYLCTQGVGGELTHFYRESYHAFDLRCHVGTPIIAVADGTITDVHDTTKVKGCHALNLTRWNSIALRVADGYVVEYLHIALGSFRVAVGDNVSAGQILCESGESGFAPEAHLHIEAHSENNM